MAVTWPCAWSRPDGKTSPRGAFGGGARLVLRDGARAHPGRRGGAHRRLTVEAVARLAEERSRIPAVDLDVRGSVAGLSEEEFGGLAQEAEKACPVSDAIRTNVEVRLRANLLED